LIVCTFSHSGRVVNVLSGVKKKGASTMLAPQDPW